MTDETKREPDEMRGDIRIFHLGERRDIGHGCWARKERWEHGDDPTAEMESVYNPEGDYVGQLDEVRPLLRAYQTGMGAPSICPMKASPDHTVCSIGFSSTDAKWYGWSHRAICGFGVGDKIDSANHLCATSGWTDEYLLEHPEADKRLPVGFEAKTLDDAKRMAIAYAEAVG